MARRFSVDGCSVLVARPQRWDGKRVLILGHGAGQGMESPFMSFFHSGGARLGLLSVTFNFPYMEQGRRAPDSRKRLVETYSSVLDWVQSKYAPRAVIAGGKSMGGRVASYVAGERESVRGLVFLGYPLHPAGAKDRLRDEHLYALEKPMLFVSGTRDPLAQRDLLEEVVGRMPRWATLHWIEGGDHSFRVRRSQRDTLSEALAALGDWLGRLAD